MTELIVTTKELRDAKAGNYRPSLYGRALSLFYPYRRDATLLDIQQTGIVTVLDISFYQVIADFAIMKDAGVGGVIIRAGQNNWVDTCARKFMQGATDFNMPFGSYWFYDSRKSPAQQAELWAETLQGFDTKLWIWADYEEKYGGNYGGWDYFYNFLEACKFYMPDRKLGIYTGYYYWIEHSPNPITEKASLQYFAQYPLWLAWYTNNPAEVRVPKPWTNMTFWQYSASGDGLNHGVGSREVDMNKFMGDGFKETFNLEEGNGGTEPMPEVTWTGKCILGPAIVRSTPAGADTGFRLQVNDLVEATGELVVSGNYQWRNIVKPHQGWVANHLLDGEEVSQPEPSPTTLPNTLYISTKEDGSDKRKYIVEE